MIDLSVAQEFSRAPGGWFRSMGSDSAGKAGTANL